MAWWTFSAPMHAEMAIFHVPWKGAVCGTWAFFGHRRLMRAALAGAIAFFAALAPALAARPAPSSPATSRAAPAATRAAATTPTAPKAAAPATAAASAPAQRILHFPANYSLGNVFVERQPDANQSPTITDHVDESAWQYYSLAKGNVSIPAGRRVRLTVAGRIWEDPARSADLERLGPKDIHSLILSGLTRVLGKAALSMDVCMPHIAVLTGLRELNLSNARVSSDALKHLPKLKNLAVFHAPDDLNHAGLVEIVKVKMLKSLHINANRLVDNDLLLLQQLPQLEDLSLIPGKFTDQALANVAQLPHLTDLSLAGAFTNQALSHLQTSASLKNMWINTEGFDDEGMRQLCQIRQLEQINAPWKDKITERGVFCFADHKSIRSLDLNHARLSNAALKVLGHIPTLECLHPGAGFTDEGVEYLAASKSLKSLSVGTAVPSPLTDRAARAVAQMSQLECLHIGGDGLTDEGVSQWNSLKSLRELTLSGAFTDRSLAVIGGLKRLERLGIFPYEPLTLAGVNQLDQLLALQLIQLYGIRKEGGTLNLSDLKHLENLQLICKAHSPDRKSTTPDSFLENDDMRGLAGLDQLEILSLFGVKIDDAAFTSLVRLKSLRTLDLTGPTQITDKGLASIEPDKQLSRLSIHQGHFTAAGLRPFENREGMNILELDSDKAFPAATVRDFTRRSQIQQITLEP